MSITGLDHINISTDRLAETCAFFADALGLEEGWRPEFGFPGAWLYEGDRAVVHLIETPQAKAGSEVAALNHFAFAIDDYEAAAARLRERGVAFRELAVPGAPVRQIFLTDPNGVDIELNWRDAAFANPRSKR